jgi:hypothetical protein
VAGVVTGDVVAVVVGADGAVECVGAAAAGLGRAGVWGAGCTAALGVLVGAAGVEDCPPPLVM